MRRPRGLSVTAGAKLGAFRGYGIFGVRVSKFSNFRVLGLVFGWGLLVTTYSRAALGPVSPNS